MENRPTLFVDRERFFSLLARINNDVHAGRADKNIYVYAADIIVDSDVKKKIPTNILPYDAVDASTYERLITIPLSEHVDSITVKTVYLDKPCNCLWCRFLRFIKRSK